MKVTAFSLPGSHPALASRLMLERKGIAYKRIDLVPALHKPLLRLAGFKGSTVPALRIDGQRLQGSREIARELDRLVPEPPLFPADPEQRATVEEAERWGDDVLQDVPRRLAWWALGKDSSGMRSLMEGSRLGLPHGLAAATGAPVIWAEKKINSSTDELVERDLRALPSMLDKVDAYIAAGTIGGEEANAADFQIFTSVRLLSIFADLTPAISARPAGAAAARVVPTLPGAFGAVFPTEWLAPLRSTAVA